MIVYGCLFLAATLGALLLTPAVAWAARSRNLVDRPGARRVHASAVPRIGGLAIAIAMLVPFAVLIAKHGFLDESVHQIEGAKLAVILGASVFMMIVGLVDDIRGLPARVKFLTQIVAAVAICAFGIRISVISVKGVFTLNLGWLGCPLTVLWIVGITNAVNLIDGLDGLCAGICAVTCAVVGIFAVYTGHTLVAALMASLLGSLVGFLYFNFNPARIFMGDSGTYFLGFLLAATSVMCCTKATAFVALALPALALGVPIFDTLFSILRRFLERRSIFAPDRSHIHHRLVDMGLRQRHVVIFLYVVTALAAGMGVFMMFTQRADTLIVFACVALLLMLVFRLAGSVSLRNTIAGIQQKLAVSRTMQHHKRSFEDAELLLREVETFDEWWEALCTAAGEMDLVRLTLPLANRDGSARTLTWARPDADQTNGNVLKMTVPIRGRGSGSELAVEAVAEVDGSIEAAGHRIAYFGRLVDEHGLDSLPQADAPRAAAGSDAPVSSRAPAAARAGRLPPDLRPSVAGPDAQSQ